MHLLRSRTRHYPWGSRSLIPALRGEEPSAKPQAELWHGAHPADPAEVVTATGESLGRLDELIARDPQSALGPQVAATYNDELPFLMKILAADEPLSLQAHPSAELARAGFDAENAAGIPLGAPNRNYKDPNHKPELIVALTEFDAMAGFRPLEKTRELFALISCPELDRYSTVVSPDGATEEANLRALFTTWITLPGETRHRVIDSLMHCIHPHLHRDDWMGMTLRNIVLLQDRYPGDVGVLGALLLNHLHLEPGEGMFLRECQLHAYIRGMGVEIMANSDNVLRGGLTSKYVDVPELVKVLDFQPLDDPRVCPEGTSDDAVYPVPAAEFHLRRVEIPQAGSIVIDEAGPAIVLSVAGTVTAGNEMVIGPTESAWIPASDPAVRLANAGTVPAVLFIASV